MTAAAEIDHIEFHPIAGLFPLMTGEELGGLIADIQARGLLEPIVLLDGKVIDGRNRYNACVAAGVKPTYRTVEFGSEEAAITFVVSTNLHRRHLNGKQKREIIARLLKANPDRSDRQIGAAIGVDNKTVASVRAEAEGREEIPHTDTRKDRGGRRQPASKPPKPATTENIFKRRIGVGVKTPVDEALQQTVFEELAKALEDACKQLESNTVVRASETPAPGPARAETDRLRASSTPPSAPKLNYKLMRFYAAFEPELKAWLKTEPTRNGLIIMHKALDTVIDGLIRMAGDVSDARDALSVSQKAEADNGVPAEQSAEAMKAKFAATEDQSIPEGIHQTQTEATDAIERAAGGKA